VNTPSGSSPGRRRRADLFEEGWLARAIFDQLPVTVWIKDLDGRYLGCNHRFASAFGAPESDIIGRRDADYHDVTVGNAYRRQDRLVVSSGKPVVFEEAVVDKTTGQRMRWETTKVLVRDLDGEPFAILGVGFDITERDATQTRLVTQTERFEAAERLAGFGSFDEDVRAGTSEWTPGMYRIFGVDPATARGGIDEAIERIHPDDRARVTDFVRTAYRTGEAFTIEHRIVVDGHVKHVEARSEYVVDEHGQVVRSFGTTHDITDRVRSEQRAETFARLIDRASDAIAIIDARSGEIVDANDKAVEQFRGTRAGLLEWRAWDLVVQVTETWWRTSVAAGHLPSVVDCDIRRSDNSTVPAEVTMELIDGPQPVVIAAARDITDRIERERAAEEAADLYRGLINGTIDGFALCDLAGTIVDVNVRYCELTGFSRDELIGRQIHELDTEQDPAVLARRTERIAANGAQVFQTEQRHRDGTTWPAEVSVSSSPASGGRLFVFIRDRSE